MFAWCSTRSAGDEMETLQQLLAHSIMAGVYQSVSTSDMSRDFVFWQVSSAVTLLYLFFLLHCVSAIRIFLFIPLILFDSPSCYFCPYLSCPEKACISKHFKWQTPPKWIRKRHSHTTAYTVLEMNAAVIQIYKHIQSNSSQGTHYCSVFYFSEWKYI